jgi:hypothetical protein
MTFEVRLKTGFFKTSLYVLEIEHNLLRLISLEQNDTKILIPSNEMLSVIMSKTKKPCFEIVTCSKSYTGVFASDIDFHKALSMFKHYYSGKTVCEFY